MQGAQASGAATGRRKLSLGIGHSGRLAGDAGLRWLLAGHLLVFGLALEDEEMVEMLVGALGLSPRLIFPLEIAFTLALLFAWGVLMVLWVRLVRRLAREGGDGGNGA